MPQITFALDIPPGINSDDTTFAAQGRWATGDNVRFRGGRPETVGGSTALNSSFNNVTKLFATASGGVYSAGAKLYSHSLGGANVDATPASGWPGQTGTRFCFAAWGTETLVNVSGGLLFRSSSPRFVEITQAPDKITAMLVTPSRQVMALGCNEETSGTFNGRCIRWCDIGDYTDWTTTATNNAGEHILEGRSPIVSGALLGESILIWTTTELWEANYIGDPSQTFTFRRVGEVGIAGLDAFAVHNNVVYFMSPELRFHAYQPGLGVQDVPCPIQREFLDNFVRGSVATVCAFAHRRCGEVWWFYPDNRDSATSPTRYVAYSLEESRAAQRPVWFRGKPMINSSTNLSVPAIIDSPLLASSLSAYGTTIIGISPLTGGSIRVIDGTVGTASQAVWSLRSADQYVEEGRRRVMIQRVQPDFDPSNQTAGVNDIGLRLYCRDRPFSEETTKGPHAINSGTTKVDFRASGKIISAELYNLRSSAACFARFGRITFDGVTMGER